MDRPERIRLIPDMSLAEQYQDSPKRYPSGLIRKLEYRNIINIANIVNSKSGFDYFDSYNIFLG